ncbi:MAG: heme exporter protein CcmB [Bacteroidota bacterium]|nr:heme exporter protein CcmB [Bacteroidota bacterium]
MLLERRQKYALGGILLYVLATLYLLNVGFETLRTDLWIVLFWVIMIFASVNAAAKSFLQEDKDRMLYYYLITSAENMLFAKFLYNCILLGIVGLLTLGGFIFLFGLPIENLTYFTLILTLGVMGFSAAFTLISSIASKASSSATLMTVLSIPIVLPQLSLLIRLSRRAADGFDISGGGRELLILLSINVIILIVSYLLFPYLWRD